MTCNMGHSHVEGGVHTFLKLSEVPVSVCLSVSVVRSGDYYLFETDSEEEEEEEKKQEEEKKKEEELPEKSAFQVRRGGWVSTSTSRDKEIRTGHRSVKESVTVNVCLSVSLCITPG